MGRGKYPIESEEPVETVYTNLALPVDNISFTFIIPPNTSDYTINSSTTIPFHKYYYRYISNIDYRVDTSGLYNITSTQVINYNDGAPQTIVVEPGYYDVQNFNSAPFSSIMKIITSGANAFKAVPNVIAGQPNFIDLSNAPQIQAIWSWPAIITNPSTFIPIATVDITQSKDVMLVYLSFCRQSTQNNFTNVAAIPITGTIGSAISGTINQLTPILPDMDVISSPTIRIRDINNNPFLLNTSILINVKILFSIKTKQLSW